MNPMRPDDVKKGILKDMRTRKKGANQIYKNHTKSCSFVDIVANVCQF